MEDLARIYEVSTHSRLKAAGAIRCDGRTDAASFNTQPPEGGWQKSLSCLNPFDFVSTHSRLKAAGTPSRPHRRPSPVSTHSRLKAAGGA